MFFNSLSVLWLVARVGYLAGSPLAFWIAVAMGITTLITIVLFWRIRPVAGMLLLPYLAWICVACTLNYEIGRLNPDADGAFGSSSTVRVEI